LPSFSVGMPTRRVSIAISARLRSFCPCMPILWAGPQAISCFERRFAAHAIDDGVDICVGGDVCDAVDVGVSVDIRGSDDARLSISQNLLALNSGTFA